MDGKKTNMNSYDYPTSNEHFPLPVTQVASLNTQQISFQFACNLLERYGN